MVSKIKSRLWFKLTLILSKLAFQVEVSVFLQDTDLSDAYKLNTYDFKKIEKINKNKSFIATKKINNGMFDTC
jgi:hypothetical protein